MMAPVRLSPALICILILASAAMVIRCVELLPECNPAYSYDCSDKLEEDDGDQLDMDVNCTSGSVSWHRVPERTINVYDISVKVECEQLTLCYDARDTTKFSVKLLDLPLNNTDSCVFRICYDDIYLVEYRQVRPQYCNYTGLPAKSIIPSSTTSFNIQTQTINLTTSSKSQMMLLSAFSNTTQTSTTKSSEESSSLSGPSNTPNPSITTEIFIIIIFITLGIIVLILVCVCLFSVTLTLKIKKSVRFSESKQVYEMTTEEEIFVEGFDTFHKGMIGSYHTGSCTSLVTVIQPLQEDKQPNIVITPQTSVSEDDTRKNIELKKECNQSSTSVTLQSELFEKATLPPVKPFDIEAGIEDNDSGYLEYNDRFSHQYLSFYSSKCSSHDALDSETYDDISVCS